MVDLLEYLRTDKVGAVRVRENGTQSERAVRIGEQ
jgi:hypothetical protein